MTQIQTSKRRLSISATAANRERAEISKQSGALSLLIDGAPRNAIFVDSGSAGTAKAIEISRQIGVSLIAITLDSLAWPEDDQMDAAYIDNVFQPITDAPPELRFLLSIRVDAPEWWLKTHPQECAGYCLQRGSDQPHVVSWASSAWLRDAGSALERMLRYILNSPSGGRLMGIQIMAGEAGAWLYPDAGKLPDIGPCMRSEFVKYAAEKYRKNTGLLRKAWFDARAEFASIACPNAMERGKADYGVFRNPHRSRKLMDYFECLANAQVNAALHFCSVVKRVSHRILLVGLESAPLTAETAHPECGHTFAQPLLESGDVDFFVETRNGPPPAAFRPYRDSAALHGKMVFVRSNPPDEALHAQADGVGAIVSISEAGSASSALSGLVEAIDKAPQRTRKAQNEIAVILDPSASLVLVDRADCASINSLILEQISLLRQAGIPFSIYSIADLFHSGFPDHKVTLFPNSFYLSEPERRRVDARVKRSGQTAVWFWAPGVIGEENIGAEAGSKCCSQKMRVEPGAVSLRTRIAVSNDPLTWGRHAGDSFAPDQPVSPTCTVADKQAVRLGANSANKTSFSVRRFDSWTSVVYGTLPVPLDLLQNLIRSGACHIYCSELKDGDRLTTDGRRLTITSRKGGNYTISLPGQFAVTELLSGKKVSQDTAEIAVTLGAAATDMYEIVARKA